MGFVYIVIGVVVGVLACLFLDVDKFSNLWAKKEEELDVKEEHNEEKK